MAREPGQGLEALKQAGTRFRESMGVLGDNLWVGSKSTKNGLVSTTRGLADRAAGTTAFLMKPVNWVMRRPLLGPLAAAGAVATVAMAVKNHYSEQRDAVNAMGFDPGAVPASPYMNSVSPDESAALQARMRDTGGASGNFAAAEAEKRVAAQPSSSPAAKV